MDPDFMAAAFRGIRRAEVMVQAIQDSTAAIGKPLGMSDASRVAEAVHDALMRLERDDRTN